jgi:predicted dehydrogenase
MVGYAFMGAAHSQAWRTVNRVYDLPARARMALICGRDAGKVADAADRLGWDAYTTDWRDLISRDDIDEVDVCTPGDSHAEIALAALAAGKHVLCEKRWPTPPRRPGRWCGGAAQAAGVRSMCGFNYRFLRMMRQLVAGPDRYVRHVRTAYLRTGSSTPNSPLCGGCGARWPAPGRSGTSARTSSISPSSSPVSDRGQRITNLRRNGRRPGQRPGGLGRTVRPTATAG